MGSNPSTPTNNLKQNNMGYLLKIKKENQDVIKMFYSEPENGCYADDIMLVSRKEYDEHYSKLDNTDYVFIEGWHDTSAELNSRESLGIEITTGTFYLDCILQGKELEYNKPYEFKILTKTQ